MNLLKPVIPVTYWIINEMYKMSENNTIQNNNIEINFVKHHPINVEVGIVDRLQECLHTSGLGNAIHGLENGWQGMIQYGVTQGSLDGTDVWYKQPDENQGWLEYSPVAITDDLETFPGAHEIIVYEPCNYRSNVAYMFTMLELCNQLQGEQNPNDGTVQDSMSINTSINTAIIAIHGTLSVGSSFLHASSTSLGNALDVIPINVIALLNLQQGLYSVPYDSILHDVKYNVEYNVDQNVHNTYKSSKSSKSLKPRMKETPSGIQYVETIFSILQTSVYGWEDSLRQIGIPNQFRTFSCIVIVASTIVFGQDRLDAILLEIFEIILSPLDYEFIKTHFLPTWRQTLPPLETMSGQTRVRVANQFIGALLRFSFAFYWQEELFQHDGLMDPNAIHEAGEQMYRLNDIIDDISNVTFINQDFQRGIDVYPGVDECRYQQPHSIWHEQSALGLTDLAFLTKSIDESLRSTSDGYTIEPGLIGCLLIHECIVFNGDDIDVSIILQCIQRIPIINPNPPCSAFANVVLLTSCLNSCVVNDPSMLLKSICALDCLTKHGRIGFELVRL